MTDLNWDKLRAEYIQTGISYRKMAEKYKVSPTTIFRRMKKENWAELRKQKDSRAIARTVEQAVSKATKHYSTLDSVADMLLERLADHCQEPGFLVEPKDYKAVASAIRDLREVKGVKTEADMREQEARINKLIKECESHVETDDGNHGVVLMPEIVELSAPSDTEGGERNA